MSISVAWDNVERTVVCLDFEGQWSWVEYDTAIDETTALLDNAEQPTHLIFNLLRGPRVPLDYVFSHLQRTARMMPKNTGWLVVVGGNPNVKALLFVFFRTFAGLGWKTAFADSLEETRALLAAQGEQSQ